VLVGANASESALKKVSAPSIVHIATHGYFLEQPDQNEDDDDPDDQLTENPLVLSGLALAGANNRGKGGDDGILTALEASGLDLWGTKLVVLSACDTGLGKVRNGEGVYGLRRSFALAGAESVVMSLWPISDRVTRELMAGYYKNLKAGMGRGEALRRVQLDMLHKKGREHPFYWASFIESGDWTPIRGLR
jgi:CHAT domain-containing protein